MLLSKNKRLLMSCRLTEASAPTDEHKDDCKAKIFKKVSSGYGLDNGAEKTRSSKG